MKLNEKGASLTIVLLVIVAFSILGLSLMGSVVNENKRVSVTESDVQARNLAESGLTYFETEFKRYIDKTDVSAVNINNYDTFLSNYKDWKNVGDNSNPEETKIKAKLENGNIVTVTSKGKSGSFEKTIVGHYKISFDFKNEIQPISIFPDGRAIDFSKLDLVGLNLLNLLSVDLLNFMGNASFYYPVPNDDILDVNLLGPVLDLNIGDTFKTMEENRVIATREGRILSADLLKTQKGSIVDIDVLKYKDEKDTNVIINGAYEPLKLLFLPFKGYKNIDFKKLAVMGNAIIQQDRHGFLFTKDYDSQRRFTFVEGLYVNKSLLIGSNWDDAGTVMLRGNMDVEQNLAINHVNLKIGDNSENEKKLKPEDYISNIYVPNGNVRIKEACIDVKNTNYFFRVLTPGKITFENNSKCSTFTGLYYAENGIEIKTNGQPMTIKGGLAGYVTVDYPEKLTIIPDSRNFDKVTPVNIKLNPQGRTIE